MQALQTFIKIICRVPVVDIYRFIDFTYVTDYECYIICFVFRELPCRVGRPPLNRKDGH